MASKKKKKSKNKKTSFKNTYLAILVLLALLAGMWYIRQQRDQAPQPLNTSQKAEEDIAHLKSDGEDASYAVATRENGENQVSINVTAYMNGLVEEGVYGVWLASGDENSELIGELSLFNEIYTLNYTGEKEIANLEEIVIAELEKDSKMGDIILRGSFSD